jgi:nucleoside-diphosphate-sugar epimerase
MVYPGQAGCEVDAVGAETRHALVLGASGFLGGAVLRFLSQRPGWRLTVLVHRREPEQIPANTRVLKGSLGAANWDWCRDDPPEFVFHCARLGGRGKWGRYFAALRGNVANRRLIRVLSALRNPPRLIYASGSLTYGDCGNEPVTEDAPLKPTSYARQYIVAERPFLGIAHNVLPVTMFRPGWILGPGSWCERFYLEPSRTSGAVPLYGAGNNVMTIIHRDDCAAAMVWVALHGKPGVYHPPSLPPITQRAFVEHLAAKLRARIEEKALNGMEKAVREAFSTSLNLSSQHGEFWKGFSPKFTDLKSALADVISEYTARIRQSASTGSS